MENHSAIQKIVENNNLSRNEIKDLLIKIISEDNSGYHFLAFSVALLTKGESIDELLGIIDALDSFCNLDNVVLPNNIMDISSSGGGKFRKLNISTLASLIISNKNVPIAKQSFWGITSVTGSANVLQNIGLKVPQITIHNLSETLNSLGLGYYHHLFMFNELKNLVNFGLILGEKKLGVNTPFNLIAPIYTPIKLNFRMFGVNSANQVKRVFEIFSKQDYSNFVVLYGDGGIDEVSTFTKTSIMGRKNNEYFEREISPADFGLKSSPYEAVKPIDIHSNTIDFLKIIYGVEKGAKLDMVLMNASLALYISDQANDLTEGINIALKYIESGDAKNKLEKLIESFGDISILHNLVKEHVI